MNTEIIYVEPSLKRKLLVVKADLKFKKLNDVIDDMYTKCYLENKKQ